MPKNLKNDCDQLLLAENLSQKNQRPGELIMRNFQSRFSRWFTIQSELIREMKVSNWLSITLRFLQLLPLISLTSFLWQYFREVNTQHELRRQKSWQNSEFLIFFPHPHKSLWNEIFSCQIIVQHVLASISEVIHLTHDVTIQTSHFQRKYWHEIQLFLMWKYSQLSQIHPELIAEKKRLLYCERRRTIFQIIYPLLN